MKKFFLFTVMLLSAAVSFAQEQDCHVKMTVVETNLYDFSVKFEPESDCPKYRVLLIEKGMMAYYMNLYRDEQGNPYTEYDFIYNWGMEDFKGVQTMNFDELKPTTEYEVYVMGFNKKGEYYEFGTIIANTDTLGGTGIAKVEITLGKYEDMECTMSDGSVVMKPCLQVYYTPNSESSMYSHLIYLKDDYEKYKDQMEEWLHEEAPSPEYGNWFSYVREIGEYPLNPDTEVVSVAAAKNLKGEWGPMTVFSFTTPHETGIEQVYADESKTSGNQRYNLAGQRVGKDAKGLVIVGGKLRVIK